MFAARRALHAKSHRSRYTGFYIAAVLFLLLPHHFFAIAASFFAIAASFFANCNEKIAAPRRTRVTNSTKICRTSLVARYAAPPCVTRYAATYIASTVFRLRARYPSFVRSTNVSETRDVSFRRRRPHMQSCTLLGGYILPINTRHAKLLKGKLRLKLKFHQL